jgi:outer membrane lipoprotein-sorting protein
MRLLCTLLLFAVPLLSSQTIDRITADFVRYSQNGSASAERSEGTVFLDAKGTIRIKVQHPVDQWVIVDKSTMLIYYPKELKAFRFTRSSPFALPLYQSFFAMNDDPADLSRYGFTLSGNRAQNDTLITTWTSPKNASTGESVNIALFRDRLAYIEVLGTDGKSKAKTVYSDYQKQGRRSFPLRIRSMQMLDNAQVEERMEYSNLRFNTPFPNDVTSFSIPASVVIRDIQW